MSETADSVVLELEAKLGNYQRDVAQGANAFQTSMKQMQASASQTEQHVGRAMGNTRLAHLELLHVVTATSDSYAAGIPITRAFTMEIGRIAEAAQLAGPALGKVGAILSGPWGIALQVGIGLLAALVSGHEKATEKATKHADAETVVTDALHGQKIATDDLAKAVAELRAQEDKALQSEDALIDRRYREAEATRAAAIATREKLKADLEAQRAALAGEKRDPSLLTPGGIGAGIGRADVAVTAQNIKTLNDQIAANDRIIADSTARMNDAATEAARKLSSNVGRAEVDFDRQQRALEIKYRGGNIDGKPVQGLLNAPGLSTSGRRNLTAQLAREEDTLRIAREKGVEAARKLDDAEDGKGKTHFGRDIDEANNERLLTAAQGYSGLNERSGKTALEQLFSAANIQVDPEKVKWCAAFVNSVLATQHLPGTGSLAAKSFETYGSRVSGEPEKGDIVTLRLGGSKDVNHVGFFAGFDPRGNVRVTGGNQGNSVSTETFNKNAVASFRRAPTADQAERLAQESLARQQTADDELARAKDALIVADRALATSAEQKAALAKQDIEADRAAYEKHITDEHDRKKLTDAEFATLKGLNDARAKSRTDLVNEQEEERKRKVAEQQAKLDTNVALGSLQAQEDLLQTQEKLAETAKDRRDIELRLLDLQFKEEKIRLEAIIAESDRLNSIQNATEAEKQAAREAAAAAQTARGQLATLPQRQANAAESVTRQTEGPMAAYRRQLMNATSDMDVALQSVEVHAFQGLEDGLTSTITKVLGLKGAFGQMAASIIADLARIEIERAILGSTNGSSGNSLFSTIGKLFGATAGSGPGSGSYIQGSFGDIGARASGGPVVAGTLYRVNEMGTEGFKPAGSGTIVPLGEMPPVSPQGGTTVLQPIHFDLRGAVMTEDILAQMNALAEQAAMRGAIGGMALTQREAARAASRRLA